MGIREETAATVPDVAPDEVSDDVSDDEVEPAVLDQLDEPEERREAQRPVSETRSASLAGDATRASSAATAPRTDAPLQTATTGATVVALSEGPTSPPGPETPGFGTSEFGLSGADAPGPGDGAGDTAESSPLFGGGYPLGPGEVDDAESFGGDTFPTGDEQAVHMLPDGSVPAPADLPGESSFGDGSFGDVAPDDVAPGDGAESVDGGESVDGADHHDLDSAAP